MESVPPKQNPLAGMADGGETRMDQPLTETTLNS
jgi:hypothetical protein